MRQARRCVAGGRGPSCGGLPGASPAVLRSTRHHADAYPPAAPDRRARVKDRLAVAAVALGAIIVFQVGREAYRWYAFRDERVAIVRLRGQVVDAGAEVAFTREQLNVMGRRVETADSALNAEVQVLRRYSLQSDGGMLPPPLYSRYLRDRRRYDEQLTRRQQWFARWEAVQGRYHASLERYTLLADSIRGLAARIGDPYYHVPLPVEAAAERGLIKVDSGRPSG
jgi:hypothetical protein